MKQLGLIGYPLSHSFSKSYFGGKFEREGISGYTYQLFPLQAIEELVPLLQSHPELAGLNVTIPYKVAVVPFLDELDDTAAAIGAVNTIRVKDGRLKGYNTDAYGFEASLRPLLQEQHKRALVLGTGGASRAIAYVLEKLGLEILFVSRHPEDKEIGYDEIDGAVLAGYPVIINSTPLGTWPDTEACPDIPYAALSDRHILYDLIYNPEETLFLKKGKQQGAVTKNGLEMLHLQAEKSWEIWTNE